MSLALELLGTGAVTPVGLDAEQSCAAIRAKLKRYTVLEEPILADEDPRIGARIRVSPSLRRGDEQWLLNLGARALAACCDQPKFKPERTALFLLVPEAHRGHPLSAMDDASILSALAGRVELGFAPSSRVFRGGAAALFEALAEARTLIRSRAVTRCVIGGADSLLRAADIDRLDAVGRLHRSEAPQGLVPGEAAAFVLLGPKMRVRPDPKVDPNADPNADPKPGPAKRPRPKLAIRGVGLGHERETVLAGGRSMGDGFVRAFKSATRDANLPEPDIDFVASNFNGEGYDALESAHAHSRCYRTRRERLPQLWPAVSTGDAGVAGGVLALIAAAFAISRGYAPGGVDGAGGKVAAIEARSEGSLRGVAILR